MKMVRDTPSEELAARYSLILPFASVVVCLVLMGTGQLVFHEVEAIATCHTLAVCIFWLMVSNLITGLASLSGIPRYGVRRILWRALVGIVFSVLVGWAAFLYLAFEHYRQ